jgi:hypothetical protein
MSEVADLKSDVKVSCYSALNTRHTAPSYRIVGGGVSEEFFEKGLCLPSGTAMEDGGLERVVGVIKALRKR